MIYLTLSDFETVIKQEQLSLLSNDPIILNDLELTAAQEIDLYLSSKYLSPFKNIPLYSSTDTYTYLNEVRYTPTGQTSPTESIYQLNFGIKPTPTQQFHYDNSFTTYDPSTNSYSTNLNGYNNINSYQGPGVGYSSIYNNLTLNSEPGYVVHTFNGETITGITSTAQGITPTDQSTWEKKDTRNNLYKMFLIDVLLYHLFSKVMPRQIPELRLIRYKDTIEKLKAIQKGTLQAPFILKKDFQFKPSINSAKQKSNWYF